MKGEAEYCRNRAIAYEIYGVKPNNPNYDCHHLVQRSDVWRYPELFGGYNVNQLANLVIIRKTDHRELNAMIHEMEGEVPVRKKFKKYKCRKRHI